MKVFQVYNQQRSLFGGEWSVIETTARLLERDGNISRLVMKSSRDLNKSLLAKMRAFCGGTYNLKSYYEFRQLLKADSPDVVHVHSLYPMFSPSILVACRRARVPVVMTVHSHLLTCPNWYHFFRGRVCEECLNGHEYRCLLKNCRGNLAESFAYALRAYVARVFRLFRDNVDLFIVLTDFARRKLLEAGFRPGQLVVIPNTTEIPEAPTDPRGGRYAAFAGRLSREKGIETLVSAAAQNPRLQVRIAGGGPGYSALSAAAPANVQFGGMLNHDELMRFYRKARFVVVPSTCLEQFGIVGIEAMAHGLPVIGSRIGGLPEVVDDQVTGLLFEPGNAEDLARKMGILWADPHLCRQMGKKGREKVIRLYSQDKYYVDLMKAYGRASQSAHGQ